MNNNGNIITTDYAGNYIYENGTLQFLNTAEGYAEPTTAGGFSYIYQYKDHLGNIRLSYSDTNNDGVITTTTEILEENNYYPFGLKHKGYNNTQNGRDHKYGFGNKEEQNELGLGWIDITARNYDAALERWMNLDPLAEAMRRHSPYNYAFDNPVYFIDPDGNLPIEIRDAAYYQQKFDEANEKRVRREEIQQQQQKQKEITEKDLDKIAEGLPKNFTAGNFLNSVVGALNENENSTIKGSTIKSFNEKKAKEQLSKLDPNNPDDAKQISKINEGLSLSEEIFNQIDRIDKKGNNLTIVPTGQNVKIPLPTEDGEESRTLTIDKNNKITIIQASSSGVKLNFKGFNVVSGVSFKSVFIDSKGYVIKFGGVIGFTLPDKKGKF